MTFENNIKWSMYKGLKITSMWIYFYLLLQTLNVPLRIGKWTPNGTCTLGLDFGTPAIMGRGKKTFENHWFIRTSDESLVSM